MVQSVKRFAIAFSTGRGERSLPIHTVYRLTCALRRMYQTEDRLWTSFSALFRADPYLQMLEGLEQDLRQMVQRMTVRGFASKSEQYSIRTTGSSEYNSGCLQCAPKRRSFTNCRDVEPSNI